MTLDIAVLVMYCWGMKFTATTEEGAPMKWIVHLPERNDDCRPIIHPAETTECHASDGWTEASVVKFAKANGARRITRVRAA